MHQDKRGSRKHSILAVLMPEVRLRILEALYCQPDRHWYMSQLAHDLKLSVSTIQRDMAALSSAGILERAAQDGRVYFRANAACPIYEELRALLKKTANRDQKLLGVLEPYRSRVLLAFLSDSPFGTPDLIVIGRFDFGALRQAIQAAVTEDEQRPGVHCFWPEEAAALLRSGQPFLTSLKERPYRLLLGTDSDFHEFIQPKGDTRSSQVT